MKPTHSLTRGLAAGTPSSSTRAGGMTSGAISSTKESTAKPTAAVAQMTHCSGVRGAAAAGEADTPDRTVAIGEERLHRNEHRLSPAAGRQLPVASGGLPPVSDARRRRAGVRRDVNEAVTGRQFLWLQRAHQVAI